MIEASAITSEQLGILRHSLGLDENGRGGVCRNHYVTGHGTDYDHCTSLVDAGLMVRFEGSSLSGGDPIFVVTEAGKQVARGLLNLAQETAPC